MLNMAEPPKAKSHFDKQRISGNRYQLLKVTFIGIDRYIFRASIMHPLTIHKYSRCERVWLGKSGFGQAKKFPVRLTFPLGIILKEILLLLDQLIHMMTFTKYSSLVCSWPLKEEEEEKKQTTTTKTTIKKK